MSWGSLGFVAAMSAVMGGAVGLMMVALMFWMCGRSWIVDHAESHGISELQSSRLGGVAVFFGAVAFFIAAEWAKEILLARFGLVFPPVRLCPVIFGAPC